MALSAYHRNARYKVYEKTDRRIRLECTFKKLAVQGTRTWLELADDAEESDTFPHVFQIFARRCLPIFEQLRQEAAEGMPSGFGPLRLISMIYGSMRRLDKAEQLLSLLVRQQRVRSRFDHAVIRRLREAGLLIGSGERGSYMLHPSYRSAAGGLSRVDKEFWATEQPVNIQAAHRAIVAFCRRRVTRPETIAEHLNVWGILPPTGRGWWTGHLVRQVLENPTHPRVRYYPPSVLRRLMRRELFKSGGDHSRLLDMINP